MTTIETPRSLARDGGWLAHAPTTLGILRQPYRHHLVEGRAGPDVYVLPPAAGGHLAQRLGLGVPVGTVVWVHNINAGSHSVFVRNEDSTSTWFVTANQSAAFVLMSGSTSAGVWQRLISDSDHARGPAQPDAFVHKFRITRSQNRISALVEAVENGYDGSGPALVIARVMPGIVLGSDNKDLPAFSTGGDAAYLGVNWFAGSKVVLISEQGFISGKGGDAGGGGIGGTGAATGTDGEAGGVAIRAAIDLDIVNLGTIQGGGGGGGGGNGSVSVPGLHGGGAGGGAGANVESSGYVRGGAAGFAATGAQKGVEGTLVVPGTGGVGSIVPPNTGGSGGNGGGPAAAGARGKTLNNAGDGSFGGAAGPAISRAASATVTFVITGTVHGSTVVV